MKWYNNVKLACVIFYNLVVGLVKGIPKREVGVRCLCYVFIADDDEARAHSDFHHTRICLIRPLQLLLHNSEPVDSGSKWVDSHTQIYHSSDINSKKEEILFKIDGDSSIRSLPKPLFATTAGLCDDMRISGASSSSASGISNGVSGMHGVILSSKYLKAAQQLLDEVVNVGNGIKTETPSKKSSSEATKTLGEGLIGGETSTKRSADLSTAERQEIQMKKAKLLNMLDEVEQRYRQYHHQMQIVISSFEQAAGIGSAKTYTALALQTISKQFRCLKDAISGQIRAANKSLGEEDGTGGKIEGSRLKFVDHQLRQQRALQQLGMIQQNVWRPQRGLPERSVSVLRAWLFEHFLHPYPKDSDKHMLAKQTGLTRSQVSNWFINARVRLWKPMVEEMYMEEVKDHEENGSGEKTSKSEDNNLEDSFQIQTRQSHEQECSSSDLNGHSCNISHWRRKCPEPAQVHAHGAIRNGRDGPRKSKETKEHRCPALPI
ncbi:unnamed protein product, partial [Vitis vinifera]